eukprot:COSAG05_NODE_219_length_13727_cov_118.855958_1_plen_88_part_00
MRSWGGGRGEEGELDLIPATVALHRRGAANASPGRVEHTVGIPTAMVLTVLNLAFRRLIIWNTVPVRLAAYNFSQTPDLPTGTILLH